MNLACFAVKIECETTEVNVKIRVVVKIKKYQLLLAKFLIQNELARKIFLDESQLFCYSL